MGDLILCTPEGHPSHQAHSHAQVSAAWHSHPNGGCTGLSLSTWHAWAWHPSIAGPCKPSLFCVPDSRKNVTHTQKCLANAGWVSSIAHPPAGAPQGSLREARYGSVRWEAPLQCPRMPAYPGCPSRPPPLPGYSTFACASL
eukprot:1156863-Pelagomonas_calceolata.AAC.14